LVFKSVICPKDPESIGAEVAIHGDFVKDIVNIYESTPARPKSTNITLILLNPSLSL